MQIVSLGLAHACAIAVQYRSILHDPLPAGGGKWQASKRGLLRALVLRPEVVPHFEALLLWDVAILDPTVLD